MFALGAERFPLTVGATEPLFFDFVRLALLLDEGLDAADLDSCAALTDLISPAFELSI